jgi:LmbE family N-acetylglucosaminyl deacetylase
VIAPRPYPPLLPARALVLGPAVVVAPHPDDEVLGCGGLIAAHREAGAEVTVILLTSGARGDPAGREDPAALAARRVAESRAALERLGGASILLLDLPDGGLESLPGLAGLLEARIQELAPRTLLFPSPFEIHPDHLSAAHATLAAVTGREPGPRLLAYEIGAPPPVNLLADVTGFMAQKERAVLEFQSQLPHQDLVGKMRALARARTINVDDPHVRYAEAFLHLRPGDVPRLLESAAALLGLCDHDARFVP